MSAPNERHHTPAEWLAELHPDLDVYDPDGWRSIDSPNIYFPITRDEFERRLSASTIGPYDPNKAGLRTGWRVGGRYAPPAGGVPNGRADWWWDRLPRRTRDLLGAAGLLVMLVGLGLFGTFAIVREPWQEGFAIPILFALAIFGLRWAPSRSTPPSQTLRARRLRAWIGLPGILVIYPLLWGSVQVFGGFMTAAYGVVIGVLVDRWALWDFKLTDLFGDSQRSDAAAREAVARHSEWDRQHRRVTGDSEGP